MYWATIFIKGKRGRGLRRACSTLGHLDNSIVQSANSSTTLPSARNSPRMEPCRRPPWFTLVALIQLILLQYLAELRRQHSNTYTISS